MFVAKVTGSLVATQKVEAMKGYKLLVVEPYRVDPAQRARCRTGTIRDRAGRGVRQDDVRRLPRVLGPLLVPAAPRGSAAELRLEVPDPVVTGEPHGHCRFESGVLTHART